MRVRILQGVILFMVGFSHQAKCTHVGVWLRDAEANIAQAQSHLGTAYMYGSGVPLNPEAAVMWWQRAAAQGEASAMLRLARTYRYGLGVPVDQMEALQWYEQAALAGHLDAKWDLGNLLLGGDGDIAPDVDLGVKWIRQAADQDHPQSIFLLGVMYHDGKWLPKDDVLALMCWRKSSDMGVSGAKYFMGRAYLNGIGGLPVDKEEASRWFYLAATEGYPWAAYSLANSYRRGWGEEGRNWRAALHWYRDAWQSENKGLRRSIRWLLLCSLSRLSLVISFFAVLAGAIRLFFFTPKEQPIRLLGVLGARNV